MSIIDRLQHGWNAFLNKDPTPTREKYDEPSFTYRPDKPRVRSVVDKSIVTSVINRIAVDCAQIGLEHVRLDDDKRFVENIDSTLQNCLTVEANIDQTARAYLQDFVASILDEGCAVSAPIDTDTSPEFNNTFKIYTMRTGRVVEWKPTKVKVRAYNENTGLFEDVWFYKKDVAIVENPFAAVMNAPNSTGRRLQHKLNLMDIVDEQASSGKLNILIQLPYAAKTDYQKNQAEDRRRAIQEQLTDDNRYGVAYIDGTEKVTQLNRPLDNNLLAQIESLQSLYFSQLGITPGVLDGTADEATMNNYYKRIIEPIMAAIADEYKRKFLSKTARTQGQSIEFFQDLFRLVAPSQLVEMGEAFSRNEIVSSNEFRQVLGMKPRPEASADELRNKNMPLKDQPQGQEEEGDILTPEDQQTMDDIDGQIDELESMLEEE